MVGCKRVYRSLIFDIKLSILNYKNNIFLPTHAQFPVLQTLSSWRFGRDGLLFCLDTKSGNEWGELWNINHKNVVLLNCCAKLHWLSDGAKDKKKAHPKVSLLSTRTIPEFEVGLVLRPWCPYFRPANFPFSCFHSLTGAMVSITSQCYAILPFSMRKRS